MVGPVDGEVTARVDTEDMNRSRPAMFSAVSVAAVFVVTATALASCGA